MKKSVIAIVAVVVVATVAVGGWLVLRGEDEATARGTCGSATYELSPRRTTAGSRSPSSCSRRHPVRPGTSSSSRTAPRC